jgi:hypothetical protein
MVLWLLERQGQSHGIGAGVSQWLWLARKASRSLGKEVSRLQWHDSFLLDYTFLHLSSFLPATSFLSSPFFFSGDVLHELLSILFLHGFHVTKLELMVESSTTSNYHPFPAFLTSLALEEDGAESAFRAEKDDRVE